MANENVIIWKSLKHGLEVKATCRTEAVLKINKILGQMKLEWVGMNDVYLFSKQ